MSSIRENNSSILKYKNLTIKVLLVALVIEAVIWMIVALANNPFASSSRSSIPSYVGNGAIVQDSYSTSYNYYVLSTQFQQMFWMIAGLLVVAVLGFRVLQKGDKMARKIAVIGMGAAAISAILQLIVIWGGAALMGDSSLIWLKIMLVGTATEVLATAVSLIMCIEENGELVGFSKIVAVISGIGLWICAMVATLGGVSDYATFFGSFLSVITIVFSCFMVATGTAILLSWFNRRDKIDLLLARKDDGGTGSYSDIRIKKEVVFKDDGTVDGGVKAVTITKNESATVPGAPVTKHVEKKEAEKEALPPLQADDMPPMVRREGEVVLGRSADASNASSSENQDPNASDGATPVL